MSKRIILGWGKQPQGSKLDNIFKEEMTRAINQFAAHNPAYPGLPFREPYHPYEWGPVETDAVTATVNRVGGNYTREEVDRALYEWRRRNRGFG